MDMRSTWNNMNEDTKRIIIELYLQYKRNGNSSTLEEIRRIFENHGNDAPSEYELEKLLH